MRDGFIKVAAGSPRIKVADIEYNAASIREMISRADGLDVNLLVLPELCLTGATCADLFTFETLLDGAKTALVELTEFTKGKYPVVVVGVPLRACGKLYNCAAVLHDGTIFGIVPKTNVSSQRQFTSADDLRESADIEIANTDYELKRDMRFQCIDMPEFQFGIEISEDLWAANPCSTELCRKGATIIANPSASYEAVGRKEYRRMLVESTSARLHCGYITANAAWGESTQDVVYSQHNLIAENGVLLAENPPYGENDLVISEIDVKKLASERRKNASFHSLNDGYSAAFFIQPLRKTKLTRAISPTPFIPAEPIMSERAEEILRTQSYGLARRTEHAHAQSLVIGISGGLDSCLALLVMVRTMDLLKRDRKGIIAVSMPGFGTTSRTRSNAELLCEQLGVTFREISIAAAVRQHFSDIGHEESVHDVTYENSQARERTQVIMDIANEVNGLVVGTGDLSELALGWATYNGDHMSMYGVNGSIPKTLVRHLVRYESSHSTPELARILLDILDTPVSPELLPANESGEIQQKTEDLVGPYELHDFFLYYMLRFGFAPKKIYRMAKYAFGNAYSSEIILKWLRTFFRRFFIQQFKRSCLPDGPKVGTVSVSPRGDWQMPSDAISALWLKEIDAIEP